MPNSDPAMRLNAWERFRLAREAMFARRLEERFGRHRKPPPSGDSTLHPVTPNRPLDLSGGAAAALAFDE